MCIYLPHWPLQRLLASDPALDSRQPIVLHARDARRGELVAYYNQAAARRGVRPGMPLAEAAALAGRGCLVSTDPAADVAALSEMAQRCERFSPFVGWRTLPESETTPCHLFLDVTAIGVLFGGEDSLVQEVTRELARLGYRARVAIAETLGAAWALAVHREPLPVAALRLPPETVDLLAQLGVRQIDQLRELPRASLPARFGEQLVQRLEQFEGIAPEIIVPHHAPPEFAVWQALEYPAESRQWIEPIVSELVKRLAADLAERGRGAARLTCRLDCSPGQPVLLDVGLYRPSAHPRHLWDLLRMQLEQTALPGAVGRVTLAAPLTAPLENRQGELFAGSRHEAERQLEALVDRLSSRLGARAVLRPELTADPLPERAVRYVPLVEPGRKRHTSRRPVHSAASRPLTLHFPPRALEVISIVPDGPPVSFRLGSQAHRVARWWGPERIETGWWRGRSVRRDYYRVEAADGQRLWLFRRLEDGAWFLHGEFS